MTKADSSSDDPGEDRIVAVCLLTREEQRNIARGLKNVYPLPDDGDFTDLLAAIGRASKGRPRS
jgi:hypothetical protein